MGIAAALMLLASSFIVSACSMEPSCDDVSHLNQERQEALENGDFEEQLNTVTELEKAEANCAEKGENPDYSTP
jgi:hypothetical protein